MITNLIRIILFVIIVIGFICFYDFDFLVKESMMVEEMENKTSSISKLPTEKDSNSAERLKKWIEEQEDISPRSTKIVDL
tara:strand:+ start:20056 stop:20295 length:240 start_codon:yes stop_codon:yes gene_type:complete